MTGWWYLLLKSLHVVSVVLFLGNIITGVFWKVHGDLQGTVAARAQALDGVIRSDRMFTLPGVMLILATGIGLALMAGFPLLSTPWILWSIVLFAISGLVFSFRVAPLQKQLLANARAGLDGSWNEAEYRRLSSAWTLWGVVATGTPLAAVFLMVMKPGG
jgi:uncharacterized membrane protein